VAFHRSEKDQKKLDTQVAAVVALLKKGPKTGPEIQKRFKLPRYRFLVVMRHAREIGVRVKGAGRGAFWEA
jgi:hypothetical protein